MTAATTSLLLTCVVLLSLMIKLTEDQFLPRPLEAMNSIRSGNELLFIAGNTDKYILLNAVNIEKIQDMLDLYMLEQTRGEETVSLEQYLLNEN